MKLCHEVKHEISRFDMLTLRMRFAAVMKPDDHTINGRYEIRSLYFDDMRDTALMEKLNGVNRREKFRIRFYNGDTSFISLEKKSKINNLCDKQSVVITQKQAQSIADGDIKWMTDSESELIRELHYKMVTKGIRPKTVVDYTREPFVYPAGNVRVTMDYNIRTGLFSTRLFDRSLITVPTGNSVILEVKWDEYLPDIIKNAVQTAGISASAFSKYAVCRAFD